MIVVGYSFLLLEACPTPEESERKRRGESGSSWMSVLVELRLKVFYGSKDCPGLLDTNIKEVPIRWACLCLSRSTLACCCRSPR